MLTENVLILSKFIMISIKLFRYFCFLCHKVNYTKTHLSTLPNINYYTSLSSLYFSFWFSFPLFSFRIITHRKSLPNVWLDRLFQDAFDSRKKERRCLANVRENLFDVFSSLTHIVCLCHTIKAERSKIKLFSFFALRSVIKNFSFLHEMEVFAYFVL